MAWNNNQWGQPQNGYGYNSGGSAYGGQGYRPPAQTNVEWIRVPNVNDVEQVTVQAGQTAWIMAQNDSVFAVRAADNMGIVTTRYFRFAPWDPAAANQQRQASIEERLTRLEEIINGNQPTHGRFQAPDQPGQQ